MIRRIDNRDFWAGVVFVAIGIAALVLGRDLNVGTAADMGEGYVPLVMAIAQIALGMLIVLITLWRDLADSGNRFDGVRWRPMFFVTAAILAGAHIVRVHRVAEMVSVARVADAIRDASGV